MLKKKLHLKKKVTFHELNYEELIKIANHLSTKIYVEKEDSHHWGCVKENALWCYLLTQLNVLEEVLYTYEPTMYWLNHCEINLEKMKNLAILIERPDIVKMVTNWIDNPYEKTTLIKYISTHHRHELRQSLLPIHKNCKCYNWKDLAKLSNTHPTTIKRISDLENNSIKTILYFYEIYGKEDINIIKFESRKFNIDRREQDNLERTLREIVFKKSE